MKKWIVTGCIVLALLAVIVLPWAMMKSSGEKVALADCLPQGPWLEFVGGCGNPTNPGQAVSLDNWREKLQIPDEIQLTTEESVRAALAGVTVRTGRAGDMEGDFFQYDFQVEDQGKYSLYIYENGCIRLRLYVPDGPDRDQFFHDRGEAYRALDACFANLHEARAFIRAFMDIAE